MVQNGIMNIGEVALTTTNVDKPEEDHDTAFVFIQDHLRMAQQHSGELPPEWILLDNQSTVDVFTNWYLL